MKTYSYIWYINTWKFPSPTGVNHYEFEDEYGLEVYDCFRPQQGLTIMNNIKKIIIILGLGFRPQQGLTIMNYYNVKYSRFWYCFRPQQGLTIMNF